MPEKPLTGKKLSTTSTKQEMLDAYNQVVRQLQEKRETEVKPQEHIEEKVTRKAVEVADTLSTEGVVQAIGDLRSSVGRTLAQLADRLEDEVGKYESIKKAIAAKDAELAEIFDIQKSAATFAALIETQQQKRRDFETEMEARREELDQDIGATRTEWEKEKKLKEGEAKDRDAAELKRREREKEEFRYAFAREQQVARDQFADEKTKVERDLADKKAEMERVLADREKTVAACESELNDLRARVAAQPKELESAVQRAAKESADRERREATTREELLKREYAGEKNVLLARIAALEATVKEQADQLARFSQQSEKAYTQVQEIAVRAIEGSSNFKSLTHLQQLLADQGRKQGQEK